MVVGDVEDIVSHEGDVGRLAVHDFPEVDGDFIFRGGAPFQPVNIRLIGGVGGETLGEGQHFEDRSPGRALHGEGAGHFDVADDVDQGFDLNAANQGRGVTGGREGSGDQDLGTGFGGETAGAGDGFEEGGLLLEGLKGDGGSHGAGDADGRERVVFGDGDGDEGVDQNFLGLEGGDDGLFQLFGHEAIGLDFVFQHGEADGAVGADADGAGEIRLAIDGDAHAIVGTDLLGGEVLRGGGQLGEGGGGEEEEGEDGTSNHGRLRWVRLCVPTPA